MTSKTPCLVGALLLGMFGCEGRDFGDGFKTSETFRREQFVQAEPTPVDVLWVVDTSCSMADEQQALADNFPAFTEFFLDVGVSFRLGVTTTNVDEEDTVGFDGQLVGTPRWLDQDTPDLLTAGQERTLLGIDPGHRDEKGLHAAYTALELLGAGANEGFVRAEANLAIVIVSDEPDFSRRSEPGSASVIGEAQFAAWLDGFKADDPTRSQLSAVVGIGVGGFDDPEGCDQPAVQNESTFGNGAQRGDGYLEAAAATGGAWQSICSDDWSAMLGLLGLLAAGLEDTFPLEVPAYPDSVRVSVDGARVTSWEFDVASNSVVFRPAAAVPRSGSEIRIEYEERP